MFMKKIKLRKVRVWKKICKMKIWKTIKKVDGFSFEARVQWDEIQMASQKKNKKKPRKSIVALRVSLGGEIKFVIASEVV